MEQIATDVRAISVHPDKLVEGVREMFHSVPMNPKRELFFKDCNQMEPVSFFRKWFPLTLKVRLNSYVRLMCHNLGIYTFAKRLFMKYYIRKDERVK